MHYIDVYVARATRPVYNVFHSLEHNCLLLTLMMELKKGQVGTTFLWEMTLFELKRVSCSICTMRGGQSICAPIGQGGGPMSGAIRFTKFERWHWNRHQDQCHL